jgi:hypothetical protein
MAKAVHVAQPGRLAFVVVGISLLNEGLVRWDERSDTHELVCGVQDDPLLGSGYENRSGTAALGPRSFEFYVIAAICIAWLELDALFTAKAELLL